MMDVNEIKAKVDQSLRKKCWYVSCGGSVAGTFELVLGEKIQRDVVVRNLAHSEDFRNYEGEANLLVWCTWRLDSAEAPITSSDDTVEHIVRGLNSLVGRDVIDVRVDLPGWDLHLEFVGGLKLHVFCDHLPGDPSFDGNWNLALKETRIGVGVGSKCEVEPR